MTGSTEDMILNNDSVPERPERSATLSALADLPEVERRTLVLAYYAAMPCDRIAETTSSTPPSVLSQLHDATRQLLEGIATHGRN